jgi:hypothetical protein
MHKQIAVFTWGLAPKKMTLHRLIHKFSRIIRVFSPSYPQCYTHRGFIRVCQWWMLDKLSPPPFLGAINVIGARTTGRPGAIQ